MIRGVVEAFSRLIAVFHKRKLDEEFDEELAVHIDLLTEENKRRGMTRRSEKKIFGDSAVRTIGSQLRYGQQFDQR